MKARSPVACSHRYNGKYVGFSVRRSGFDSPWEYVQTRDSRINGFRKEAYGAVEQSVDSMPFQGIGCGFKSRLRYVQTDEQRIKMAYRAVYRTSNNVAKKGELLARPNARFHGIVNGTSILVKYSDGSVKTEPASKYDLRIEG